MDFNDIRTRKNIARAFSVAAAGLGIMALAACGQTSHSSALPGSGAKPAAQTQQGQQPKGANDSNVTYPGQSRPHDECLSRNLSLHQKPAEGTAGHSITQMTFTNVGGEACYLYGYPGVSYVAGDDGHQVGGSGIRNGATARTVWIRPGHRAYAYIMQADIDNYSNAECMPRNIRGFRIYPPNETAAKYVPAANVECANTKIGRPTVSPITTNPSAFSDHL